MALGETMYHPAVAGFLGRATVAPNYAPRGGENPYPFMIPGYKPTGGETGAGMSPGERGITAALNLEGFDVQGRLSAGFLGVIVIALGAFYIFTRGFQL